MIPQVEDEPGIAVGSGLGFFSGDTEKHSHFVAYVHHKRAFVSFATMRDRGKVRRISLQYDPFQTDGRHCILKLSGIFEGYDPVDAEKRVRHNRKNLFRIGCASGETVEQKPRAPGFKP